MPLAISHTMVRNLPSKYAKQSSFCFRGSLQRTTTSSSTLYQPSATSSVTATTIFRPSLMQASSLASWSSTLSLRRLTRPATSTTLSGRPPTIRISSRHTQRKSSGSSLRPISDVVSSNKPTITSSGSNRPLPHEHSMICIIIVI